MAARKSGITAADTTAQVSHVVDGARELRETKEALQQHIVIDSQCLGCKKAAKCGNVDLRFEQMAESYRAEFGHQPHADAMAVGEVCYDYITRGCSACDTCHYTQPTGKGCPF